MKLASETNKAQVAYEAYCQHTGWKSLVSGQALPQWHNLKPEIQAAWQASADALTNLHRAIIREIYEKVLNMCHEIEKLPASPKQTELSIAGSTVRSNVNDLLP